jgi:hypothetical protein
VHPGTNFLGNAKLIRMGDAPPHEGNTQLTVQEDLDEHFAKTFCYKAGTKKPQRHLIYWGFDDWRRESPPNQDILAYHNINQ